MYKLPSINLTPASTAVTSKEVEAHIVRTYANEGAELQLHLLVDGEEVAVNAGDTEGDWAKFVEDIFHLLWDGDHKQNSIYVGTPDPMWQNGGRSLMMLTVDPKPFDAKGTYALLFGEIEGIPESLMQGVWDKGRTHDVLTFKAYTHKREKAESPFEVLEREKRAQAAQQARYARTNGAQRR